MTYGYRESLVEEFWEAHAEYEAAKVSEGWTASEGWGTPSGPIDQRASTRAYKRMMGLYSEVKDIEAAMKDDAAAEGEA